MPTFDTPGGWPPGERLSYVSGASTTSNYATTPQFRAMNDGSRGAKLTSILLGCGGRGGARTARFYAAGGYSAYFTVPANSSAVDAAAGITAWVGAGGSFTFGMEVNGSFYVGTDTGSGSAIVGRISYVECPTRCGTPTFSGVGQTSLTVNWTAPSDNGGTPITGYMVQIAENSAFTVGKVSHNVTGLTKQFTGLDPDTVYYARVFAKNEVTAHFSDYSPSSLVSSVRTDAGTPSAPQNSKAVETSPTTTRVDWSAPSSTGGSAIIDYTVQYSQSSTFASGVTSATVVAPSTVWDSPALAVGTWYFRVRARNANGNGSFGSTVSNKIDAILGLPKVRLSGAFASKPTKVRLSGAFVQKPLKVYTGGTWKVVN